MKFLYEVFIAFLRPHQIRLCDMVTYSRLHLLHVLSPFFITLKVNLHTIMHVDEIRPERKSVQYPVSGVQCPVQMIGERASDSL